MFNYSWKYFIQFSLSGACLITTWHLQDGRSLLKAYHFKWNNKICVSTRAEVQTRTFRSKIQAALAFYTKGGLLQWRWNHVTLFCVLCGWGLLQCTFSQYPRSIAPLVHFLHAHSQTVHLIKINRIGRLFPEGDALVLQTGWLVAVQMVMGVSVLRVFASASSAGPGETPQASAHLLWSRWATGLHGHCSTCTICFYWWS